MQKLQGKIAVITGGSSGIGLAAARRFVDEGAYVFITGRRQAELDNAKSLIGRNVTAVRGDIASVADLDQLFATVKEKQGALDIVVANAAFVERHTIETATPEHFDRTFAVNARGTFFTVQKALPLIRSGGSVILVASGGHLKGFPMYGTYSATKAVMRSFSRTWANELKDRGIRVNTLSPGSIDTPIVAAQFATQEEVDTARAMSERLTPLGRIGQPEEMAAALLFLASGDSSFCTGIDLVADGGVTQL